MAILKMTQVCYEDNDQKIINNISHYIEKSSVTTFLGKPGSGKSTALKLLAGLIPPTSGRQRYSYNESETKYGL